MPLHCTVLWIIPKSTRNLSSYDASAKLSLRHPFTNAVASFNIGLPGTYRAFCPSYSMYLVQHFATKGQVSAIK